MNILLSPPVAFLIYLPIVIGIFLIGKILAGRENPNPMKLSGYYSGEEAPTNAASPGYAPFFLGAFFFAILHLGMLVVSIGGFSYTSGIFLIGLILALVAFILG